MNLIISAATAARNEIATLGSVSQWLISHCNSGPSLGQVDDSIIGLAELTRSNIKYTKYNAMLLFANTTYYPSFKEMTTPDQRITGRDIISKSLDETPINFQRQSEWFKPHMAPYINYDPTEIKVMISAGKLLSGMLDKSSIGKGANGGVYHIICNEFGASKALEVMFNMQQMAIAHTAQQGYTIGIQDLMITPESRLEIEKISADIVNKSQLVTEKLRAGEIIPPIGMSVEEFFEQQQINILSIFDDFTEPILRAINHDTNNLFKLIMTGSKGKMENLYNMLSSIGQKKINGERIRQTFGFKRTSPYFPRFDQTPEARGYIDQSYIEGQTSVGYAANAAASRFDLITKALSTSITGEQNRKSIKSLESTITNNYRWAVKNNAIMQLAYGEDYLDPRRVERVKFPTVMLGKAAFDDLYKFTLEGYTFQAEYDAILADREKYRKLFMTIEQLTGKNLMSDVRSLGVNVERVCVDITTIDKEILATPNLGTMKEMAATVTDFCHKLPYALWNEIQEARGTPIDGHLRAATWLIEMATRSYLHPRYLLTAKITPIVLRHILDKIKMIYQRALIDPGSAIGITAAQSFSEPLTQYMLDAHHRSATGGTSNSTMIHAKEILAAKDLSKLANPQMTIPVLPQFANDKARVQEIANSIEMMKFGQFVVSWQIFFEKYAEPVHPQYAHETQMHKDFAKLNPLMKPPGDLVKWCIRFAINKTSLILKNMALELIVTRIRETFPEMFVIYTPENSSEVILRIYMRNTLFKGAIQTPDVTALVGDLLSTIIRGVDGLTNTQVVKMIRNKIDADGAVVRDDNYWGITSNGSNLRGVFNIPGVDAYSVHTDAIQEMARVFGIEAARQKVISELRGIVDSCNHRHYLQYADEMTANGRVTPIESNGVKTRESANVLLRIGFSSPLATMEEAAVNCLVDQVTGITAPLLVGNIPRHGTLYNQVYVNEEFVRKNVKRADDILDEL